jgi:MFS transporter, PPP family, 3-phenylpropionic acid transporter
LNAIPYWRLSAYYLFYFASLGALVPYWSLYLQVQGFNALAIGQLLALLSATKIIAPIVGGTLVDHSGQRMPLVRYAAFAAALTFGTVFIAHGFWQMTAAMLLFSFFWNASLPQVEAVTFNHLYLQPSRYALIRLWGSIGFIVIVALLGWRLRQDDVTIIPLWIFGLFIGVWLSSLFIPDSAPVPSEKPTLALRILLQHPAVIAFFAACFLMQLSHGIYYAFYSIHLQAAGYSSIAIGALWALGVIAEVLIFLIVPRLLDRFGARHVLLWSLLFASGRWLLIGAFVEWLPIQIVAQLLHALSFGTFHAAAIHHVHHIFPGRTQGRGQALYNSLSFGAGGAAGSVIGGLLWTDGGALLTFGVGATAAALGWVLALRGMTPELVQNSVINQTSTTH